MKIAVNTRFLLKNKLEGIGWFTHEVVRKLVISHPEHTFYFLFDRPFDPSFVFADNVRPIVVNPPARHPLLWYTWFELAVPRVLKRIGADIFLSPDGYCSIKTDTPTVMVVHDLAFNHFPGQVGKLVSMYYKYFTPKYLNAARHIVAVSEFTRADIISTYSIPPQKVSFACNGGRPVFKPVEAGLKSNIQEKYAGGKPYFIYVGAIHPRKNVARLIHAFSRFKEKYQTNFKLLLTGRLAWKSKDVVAAYTESAYQDDINFLGFVGDELSVLLASSEALVYVSKFEGFGIPILEAMHCEVPVITSNVSSMPEVAGEAALLVDPDSNEQIVEAMHVISSKPEVCSTLIEKGKLQRTNFSWDKAAQVVWAAIEKINNQ